MSQDFFFLNRAHQVARLCPAACPIPPMKTRQQLPQLLSDFYSLLEEVCQLGNQASDQDEATKLAAPQRSKLARFEKQLVQLRFSADDKIKQPAVQLIRAIFGDAAYFSGLKPLPQYTDRFAYELLFPSWLNLLSAMMMGSGGGGKPKLEGRQQGAVFQFLSQYAAATPTNDSQATAYMTFIANRAAANNCDMQLQRLADLLSENGDSLIEVMDSLEASFTDARDLAVRLQALLTVKYSTTSRDAQSAIAIAARRPTVRSIPGPIVTTLESLEQSRQWEHYFKLATPLANLIDAEQALAPEFARLLVSHLDRAGDLLALLPVKGGKQSACPLVQRCAASLAEDKLLGNPQASLTEVQQQIEWLMPRMIVLTEAFGEQLCERLQDKESPWRSKLIVAASDGEATSAQADMSADSRGSSMDTQANELVSDCFARAKKSSDARAAFEWLAFAAAFGDNHELHPGIWALDALLGVMDNRSIGSKELSDLLGDMQRSPAEALVTLANPLMTLAGKSPRLASLYLTLNDITETFRSTGVYGNFSVVRARYAAMTQ